MPKDSKISWTHHTFNIVWGCTMISPGCTNCYAKDLAERFGFNVWGPKANRRVMLQSYWDAPLKWNAAAAAIGERHRVFCSSMADVFEDHPTTTRELKKLWPLIKATPNLDWLLLTKRADRLAKALPTGFNAETYPNVWVGVSVEDQQHAINRIPYLLRIPAAQRFLSCEPLLGPLDLTQWLPRLHWVIAGGESGNNHRPMPLIWAQDLRAQCEAANVPFWFKQTSARLPGIGEDALGKIIQQLPNNGSSVPVERSETPRLSGVSAGPCPSVKATQ